MTLQSLLTITKDGDTVGPLAPIAFAQEAAKGFNIKLSGLARVIWNNNANFSLIEDEGQYDSFLFHQHSKKNEMLFLIADTGVSALPVAMVSSSDREIVYTNFYKNSDKFYKPSDKEIHAMFDYAFEHLDLLAPQKEEK